jgi:ABC-2 type transport system permease protein
MVLPIIFGLVLGISAGRGGRGALGAAGTALFPVAILALNVSGSLAPDTIAGERERHTLETLLATPVGDFDILVGKLVAVVAYGWSLAVCEMFVVALAALITGGGQSPFDGATLAGVAALALLEAALSAIVGVLVSIGSPTVRAAQRSMALFSMVGGIVGGLANIVFVLAQRRTVGALAMVAVAGGLALMDGFLLLVTRARFSRGRMLLD